MPHLNHELHNVHASDARGARCTFCDAGTGKNACKNIDECARGIHKCDENAICEDTVGSYMVRSHALQRHCNPRLRCSCDDSLTSHSILRWQCRCKPGFRGGGEWTSRADARGMQAPACLDINECIEGLDIDTGDADGNGVRLLLISHCPRPIATSSAHVGWCSGIPVQWRAYSVCQYPRYDSPCVERCWCFPIIAAPLFVWLHLIGAVMRCDEVFCR